MLGDYQFPNNNLSILPISGGACPFQLGILRKLCRFGYDTGIMFGASGGNIAAWIAHAANFDADEITRLSLQLSPSMFCSNWNEIVASFSLLQGQLNGSLFNRGEDNTEFLERSFKANYGMMKDPQTREIWSAAFNTDMKRTALFCNRNPEDSILGKIDLNCDIYKIDPPSYAYGKLRSINSIIAASAAIPCVVPPVVINGYKMVDAGVSCASPMFIMGDLFKDLDELHMFYIGCENLDKKQKVRNENINFSEKFTETRNTVIFNTMCNDRRKCYELLTCGKNEYSCQIEEIKNIKFDFEGWKTVKTIRENSKKSLIEIFPSDCDPINMTSFTPRDFSEKMDFAEFNSNINVWYIKK